MKSVVTKIALTLICFCSFHLMIYGQDYIKKSDTDSIKCKVIKVGSSEIEFKKWDNQDGPTYTINRKEIITIRYKNGTIDEINQPKPQVKTVEPKTKTNLQNEVKKEPELKFTDSTNNNSIMIATGWFYPWIGMFNDLGYSNKYTFDPIMISYERRLKNFSLGAMLLYTSASADYNSNFLNPSFLTTQSISEDVIALGIIGNYYIYENKNIDISAGVVLGLAFISATLPSDYGSPYSSSSTPISIRINCTSNYHLNKNFGFFSRLGIQNMGDIILFDTGFSYKFQ